MNIICFFIYFYLVKADNNDELNDESIASYGKNVTLYGIKHEGDEGDEGTSHNDTNQFDQHSSAGNPHSRSLAINFRNFGAMRAPPARPSTTTSQRQQSNQLPIRQFPGTMQPNRQTIGQPIVGQSNSRPIAMPSRVNPITPIQSYQKPAVRPPNRVSPIVPIQHGPKLTASPSRTNPTLVQPKQIFATRPVARPSSVAVPLSRPHKPSLPPLRAPPNPQPLQKPSHINNGLGTGPTPLAPNRNPIGPVQSGKIVPSVNALGKVDNPPGSQTTVGSTFGPAFGPLPAAPAESVASDPTSSAKVGSDATPAEPLGSDSGLLGSLESTFAGMGIDPTSSAGLTSNPVPFAKLASDPVPFAKLGSDPNPFTKLGSDPVPTGTVGTNGQDQTAAPNTSPAENAIGVKAEPATRANLYTCSWNMPAVSACRGGICDPGYECDPLINQCCLREATSILGTCSWGTPASGACLPGNEASCINRPGYACDPSTNLCCLRTDSTAPNLGSCSWGQLAKDYCLPGNTCRNTLYQCDPVNQKCCAPKGSVNPLGSEFVCQTVDVLDRNVNCRNSIYPSSQTRRLDVADSRVSWTVAWPDYNPPEYTSPKLITSPDADPPLGGTFDPRFNTIDGNINRISYSGVYQVVNGAPRNPVGRTGLLGRGGLPRWGPNHVADPIVTRWKRNASNQIEISARTGKQILQFISIVRGDNTQWTLPGGAMDAGETPIQALRKGLQNLALGFSNLSQPERDALAPKLNLLLSNGYCVFAGYIDGPKNTDNAWYDTVSVNFHDENGDVTRDQSIPLRPGFDTVAVQWVDMDSASQFYPAHRQILARVAELRGAHW